MPEACRHCAQPLAAAPTRACPACGDLLHVACWAQIEAGHVSGCGHDEGVMDAAFLDVERLVTVDAAGAARLWNLSTCQDQLLVTGGEPVRRALAAPAAGLLVLQGDARLWVRSGAALDVERSPELGGGFLSASALSADGARLVVAMGPTLRGGDPRSAGPLKALGAPCSEDVMRLALSPDGGRLAVQLASGTIVIKDAEFGFDLGTWPSPPITLGRLAFSDDGEHLLLSDHHDVCVLDGLTARLERRLSSDTSSLLAHGTTGGAQVWLCYGPHGSLDALRVEPDGARHPLASFQPGALGSPCARLLGGSLAMVGNADGTALVADLAQGRLVASLRGHRNERWLSPGGASRLLWSAPSSAEVSRVGVAASGLWICHTDPPSLRLLRRDTGELAETRPLPEVPLLVFMVEGVSGPVPATGGPGGLWVPGPTGDCWQAEPTCPIDGSAHVATAAGPWRLVVCSPWSASIESFDHDGRSRWAAEHATITPLTGRPLGAGPNGWRLLTRPPTGACELCLFADDGALVQRRLLDCPRPVDAEVGWLTPDGAHALLTALQTPDARRTEVGLFDLERNVFVAAIAGGHRVPIRDLAVSPLGTLLATCASDRSVRVWSLPSGRQLAAFATSEPLRSVRFGPDGATLYTWSESNGIDAWDLSGLDRRSDLFGALHRSQSGDTAGRATTRRRLEQAATDRDPEALAALLLFRALHPACWAPEPDPAWVDAVAETLRGDLDRRVRALVESTRDGGKLPSVSSS